MKTEDDFRYIGLTEFEIEMLVRPAGALEREDLYFDFLKALQQEDSGTF